MKILITGVAGFIGSNLATRLLDLGHDVSGVDNLSQGDLLNIEEIHNHKKFKFGQIDILNANELQRFSSGCEMIYHLAAYKIPRYGDAYDTLNINTSGTKNVIDVAVQNSAHVVYASTSDVYGKNPKVPFTEDHDLLIGPPTVKRWAYAISKAYGEQMCFAELERRSLKFSIVRFFGGYGPNQNLTWWGGPQSVFIDQSLKNQSLTIHGEGVQRRCFSYIADYIDALAALVGNKAALSEVINIGNDEEISILELAKLVWRLCQPNIEPKIELIPYNTFGKYEDVQRRIPDLTKCHKILGFTPRWPLEKGLPLTIEWQKKRRSRLENKK